MSALPYVELQESYEKVPGGPRPSRVPGQPRPSYTRHDGTVVPLVFTGTRHCVGGCDRWLPLSIEFFRTDNRRPSGLGYICRDCKRRKDREYRQAHPEKARERDRMKAARSRAGVRAREVEAVRKVLPPELRWLVSLLNRKQLQLVLARLGDG